MVVVGLSMLTSPRPPPSSLCLLLTVCLARVHTAHTVHTQSLPQGASMAHKRAVHWNAKKTHKTGGLDTARHHKNSHVEQNRAFETVMNNKNANVDKDRGFERVEHLSDVEDSRVEEPGAAEWSAHTPSRLFDPTEGLDRLLVKSYFRGSVDYLRAVPGLYEGGQGVVSSPCILDLMDMHRAMTARDTRLLSVLSAQGSLLNKAGVHQTCPSDQKLRLFNQVSRTSGDYNGFHLAFCLATFEIVGDIGLCVPKSCNKPNLNYVLIQGFPVSYKRQLMCGRELLLEKDHKYTIMLYVLLLIILLNLAATAHQLIPPWISRPPARLITTTCFLCPRLCHMICASQSDAGWDNTDLESAVGRQRKESKVLSLVQCFHVPNNIRALFSLSTPCRAEVPPLSDPGVAGSDPPAGVSPPPSVTCLPGMRVVSMVMVVFFHTFYFTSDRNLYNKEAFGRFESSSRGVIVAKSNVCVEAFFVVSAMLATTQALSAVRWATSPLRYVCSAYFKRLWRLAPVYYFLVFTQTYLVPYWSDTPLYGASLQTQCVTALPSHLTFTYNLHIAWSGIKSIDCLPQSWFLGADMQMFLLVPWLAVLYRRSRRAATLLVTLSPLLCCIVVTLVGVYKTENTWNATWLMYSLPEHMNSYVSGVLLGVVYHRGYLNPKWAVKCLLVLLFCLCACLVHVSEDWQLDGATNLTEIVLFTSWRSCYGVMVALTIYFCCVHHSSVLTKLLSSPAWLPLSRLSYATFLVSCGLQSFMYKQGEGWPVIWSPLEMLFDTTAFVSLSVILSAAVWLLVECPARNLSHRIWTGRKS